MTSFDMGMLAGLALGIGGMGGYACTAREGAKDAYVVQSEACIRAYQGDATKQRSCLDYVRGKWDDAGAPKAAVDGGGE